MRDLARSLLLLTIAGAILLAYSGLVLAQGNGHKHGKPPPPGSNTRVCPSDGPKYAHCDAVRHDADTKAPSDGGEAAILEAPPTTQETTKEENTTSEGTSKSGPTQKAATPKGYFPADLQSAYNLPSDAGAGQTVAIVDAYDDPKAESDLAKYRSKFNLPSC